MAPLAAVMTPTAPLVERVEALAAVTTHTPLLAVAMIRMVLQVGLAAVA